jgi:hypothetical protein
MLAASPNFMTSQLPNFIPYGALHLAIFEQLRNMT